MLPFYLLILCLPLGVAGQNIGLGLVTAIFIVNAFLSFKSDGMPDSCLAFMRIPLMAAGAFLLVHVIAMLANPASPAESAGKFLGGYGAWWLLPWISAALMPRIEAAEWERLAKFSAVIIAVMGIIAFSQYVFGWRIQGASLVADGSRARGLYSHPLTFSYVGLLLFGAGTGLAFQFRKKWWAWTLAIGAMAVVFFSLSRMVLVTAVLIVGAMSLWQLQGKARVITLSVLIALAAGVLVTDNPVSRRFSHSIKKIDVQGDHIDDRFIFWKVAADMISERPVLGHGPELDTAYRKPYYERAGYGDLEKQYEAHNVYLQVWVTGGILSLVAFLVWWAHLLLRSWRVRCLWSGRTVLITSLAFLLASLTQNSFQDSEVRFAVVIGVTLFSVMLRDRRRGEAVAAGKVASDS